MPSYMVMISCINSALLHPCSLWRTTWDPSDLASVCTREVGNTWNKNNVSKNTPTVSNGSESTACKAAVAAGWTWLLSFSCCIIVLEMRMLTSCTTLATSNGVFFIILYNIKIFGIGKNSNHLCWDCKNVTRFDQFSASLSNSLTLRSASSSVVEHKENRIFCSLTNAGWPTFFNSKYSFDTVRAASCTW